MDIVQPNCELLVVTKKGMGKRTPLENYRKQTRGGKGLKTMAITDKGGPIVAGRVVCADDRMIILTSNGIAIRLRLNEIRCCGRSTMGVRLINLTEGDTVSSVAIIPRSDEEVIENVENAEQPGPEDPNSFAVEKTDEHGTIPC